MQNIRSTNVKEVSTFIIDETMIKIGSQKLWLWICIEPIHKIILGIYLSQARNMLVARQFLESLIEKYGKHSVYSDGGTWYPEACKLLGLKQYLHSPLEKSLIERMGSISKIELNLLMITIHVIVKEIVIMVMAITGYNYLYQCTIIR